MKKTLSKVIVLNIKTVLIQQKLLYFHNDDTFFRPPELDIVFNDDDLFERILYPDQRRFFLRHFLFVRNGKSRLFMPD